MKYADKDYIKNSSIKDLITLYEEIKSHREVTDVIDKDFFFKFSDRILEELQDLKANLYSANSIISEYIEERNNVIEFLKSIIFDDKMSDVKYQEQRKLAIKIFKILEGGTVSKQV